LVIKEREKGKKGKRKINTKKNKKEREVER
jgi:hypothetical protein